MRRTQEPDGSWFGRWGVNYIYGTWQTLAGLAAIGVPIDDPMIVAGANWLLACQQPGGGWGESPDSYAEPHKRGQGKATASQTAWALLGLMAAGRTEGPAVQRGVAYLVENQGPDGAWSEPEFTGTGFPRVFYLRYHMYPIYFPLMAVADSPGKWLRAKIDRRSIELGTGIPRDADPNYLGSAVHFAPTMHRESTVTVEPPFADLLPARTLALGFTCIARCCLGHCCRSFCLAAPFRYQPNKLQANGSSTDRTES